jgi:hypothetical protein
LLVTVVPADEVVVSVGGGVVSVDGVVGGALVLHARVWTGYQIASASIDVLPALSSATSARE